MTRVLVVACSEAEPSLLDQFARDGDLPAFDRLRANGATGTTVYDAPWLLTPQCWATIATGTDAGRHGVFDYWQRDATGRYRETSARDVRVEPFWSHLDRAGARVGLVHLPLTHPAPALAHGFAVAGQDAPGLDRAAVAPRSLGRDLRRRFGPWHVKDLFPAGHDKAAYAPHLLAGARRQREIVAHLAATQPWDVFVCYLPAVAMAQHYYWADMGTGGGFGAVVRDAYKEVDATLGALADLAAGDGGTDVFFVSECGAGPLRAGVRINALLAPAGLLRFTATAPRTSRRVVASVGARARRSLPPVARGWAARAGVKASVQGWMAGAGVDWARTAAFHRGKGEGNVYVNLRGRERHGSVAPDDYETVRDAVVAALADVRDPATGERAVAAVHRREDLFTGPHVGAAPDLVVEWADMAYMPAERDASPAGDDGSAFTERVREYMNWPTTGSHRPGGVFVAHGPGITAGADVGPVALRDLAPLWCARAGHPMARTVDVLPSRERAAAR